MSRDDAFLDSFAQVAMDDMFGKTPEGQKLKETYQQTGRLVPMEEEVRAQRVPQKQDNPGVTIVKPMDYRKLAQAVSEETIVESIISNPDYSKERDTAITNVANEAKSEAAAQLSKILKSLR